jgi:hypothetical protein
MPNSSDDVQYWSEIVNILKDTNFVSDNGIAMLGHRESPASTIIHVLQPTQGDEHTLEFKNMLITTFEEKGIDNGIEVILGHMSDSEKIISRDYSDYGGIKPTVIFYSSETVYCG